jgi:hypothetical protein
MLVKQVGWDGKFDSLPLSWPPNRPDTVSYLSSGEAYNRVHNRPFEAR